MTTTMVRTANALVLLGDRVEPRPYLRALVELIGKENAQLAMHKQVQYLVCPDYSSLALALRRHRERIRLVLVGPGFHGKQDVIVRLLGGSIRTVLVLDPKRSLADSAEHTRRLLRNLRDLGCLVVPENEANAEFYQPLVRDHVVAGILPELDLGSMTPEQRAEHLDRRLDSVTMFPSLPETQRRVAALKDSDPPKNWAAAIDPDPPMRTVILALLNSAHYSFRSRITSIEQAVALVSAHTIREVVVACTIQKLFKKLGAARIDQFWHHAVATGFFARLFSIVADPSVATPQEKSDLERYGLEPPQVDALRSLRLWEKFELKPGEDPFTAGLLHDIGKVTMALCFEDALLLMDPLIEAGVKEKDAEGKLWAESTVALEHSLMGDMDHQAVGARIARKWGVDATLQEVIAHHHDVRRNSAPLTRLVALADLAANTIHPYPYQEEHHPFPRMLAKVREAVSQQKERQEDAVLDEVFPSIVGARLEEILTGLAVSEALWRAVEAPALFRACYRLGPAIRRVTNSFLSMTAAAAG
jgi:putative nucleotidyltransferase with HDIG domain